MSNQALNLNNDTRYSKARIAFIQASWHLKIVEQAYKSFISSLEEDCTDSESINAEQVELFSVPGSLEIPLQAKLLAETKQYDIIVAAGLIVNGGIYRHDFVARTVIDGMMQVQLETRTPILSVVLTPHNFHESQEHQDFFLEHFKVKGKEAAKACLQTLKNVQVTKELLKAA